MPPTNLSAWKDLTSIIQSAVTVAAIIAGSIWALYEFELKRVHLDKLSIASHNFIVGRYGDQKILSSEITIENVGTTMFSANSAQVRVERLAPLPSDVRGSLDAGRDPVSPGTARISWPILCRYKVNVDIEIEPSERHVLQFDFAIPREVDALRIYFFMPHEGKRDRESFGWSNASWFHDEGEELVSALSGERNDANPSRRLLCRNDQ